MNDMNYPKHQGGRDPSHILKTGLLMIVVGLFIAVVPGLGAYLSILILIGIIFAFLGSKVLGKKYRRNYAIAILLIIVMSILELYGLADVMTLMSSLYGATSANYSEIIKAIDPFIFFVAIAYVLLAGSLTIIAYPFMKNINKAFLWIFYFLTVIIVLVDFYFQMNQLNQLYYQSVTLNNVGQFTTISNYIYYGGSAFYFLWGIVMAVAYANSRKMLQPPIPSPGYQNYFYPTETRSSQSQEDNNINNQNNLARTSTPNQNNISICPTCGAANPIDARFCQKCGQQLKP